MIFKGGEILSKIALDKDLKWYQKIGLILIFGIIMIAIYASIFYVILQIGK